MSQRGNSLFAGSVVLVLYAGLRKWIPLHNIPFFVVGCILFCAAAAAVYMLQERKTLKEGGSAEQKGVLTKVLPFLPVVLTAIWIVMFYIMEPTAPSPMDIEALLRRQFPLVLWIVIVALGTCACLFLMRKSLTEKGKKLRTIIRAVVSVLFSIATSVQFYAPNILEDVQGNIYHSHAYTATIINTAWLMPYSERITSNYGHYGILFLPFLRVFHKLFGLDYITAISLICAVLQGISILVFALILHYFVKNEVIFYLALFGIGEYYFQLLKGGVFHQVHPHRMIFPILLVLLVLGEKVKNKHFNILAIVLLTLSIIWSTEVGIIMALSYAVTRWVDKLYEEPGFTVKKCLNLLIQLCLFLGIPFAASYVIVNLYNVVLAHGPWLNFADFMFPLVSEKGYITHIELELPGMWDLWVGNAVIFLGAVGATFVPVLFPKKKPGKMYTVIFFMGLMGLGIMTYYVNRPVEGCLFVNIYITLILLSIFLQKAQDVYEKQKEEKKDLLAAENLFPFLSMRVVVVMILFVLAFDSLYSMPSAWKKSSETIWRRDAMQDFADYIALQVPPDAVAFGMAVPEIFSMIDRDTHLYTTDWGIHDMAINVLEDVRYELEDAQWIFCNMQSLYEMEQEFPGLSEQYELNELMEYNQYQFGFWIRK